jgi:NTP pyrophosphatase (non-canonical NTP hydrolase)
MGWWDEERNTGELLMLIVSECGEALEADRSQKHADLKKFDAEVEKFHKDDWVVIFKDNIKDTFEDELADIVIRIADLCGASSEIVEYFKDREIFLDAQMHIKGNQKINVGESLMAVVKALSNVPNDVLNGTRTFMPMMMIHEAIIRVMIIASEHDINLPKHIELKLAYNRTRGNKHGKAY